MLQWNRQQLDALAQAREADFEDRLAEFLRSEFPSEFGRLENAAVRDACVRLVRDVAALGILEPIPTAQLACLAVLTRGAFLSQPDIRAYLADGTLAESERVQLLLDELAASGN